MEEFENTHSTLQTVRKVDNMERFKNVDFKCEMQE